MKDDYYLLEKMTPLFIKNLLLQYEGKYDANPATIRHIKASFVAIVKHNLHK